MTLTGPEIPLRRQGFPVELLFPAEMAEIDRRVARDGPSGNGSSSGGPSGDSASLTLMEHAGRAVAQTALRLLDGYPTGATVAVLCGPGNNGGDGFVAARLLAEAGLPVRLALLGEVDALKGDAAKAAARWSGPLARLDDLALDDVDLAIDALFGAGLSRDVAGAAETVIRRLNAWSKAERRPVLAVDVPSGIDGASGAVRGVAVQAGVCVTFFRLKPGHVLLPGRLHCGSLMLADIGLDARLLTDAKVSVFLNAPALWASRLPIPGIDGHKYQRGHAVVLSGPVAQTGAARLAARGALRAGAGLTTVLTPTDALAIHAAALTAIMTRVCDSADDLDDVLTDRRKNAVVLGPGLGVGQRTRDFVMAVLTSVEIETGEDDPPRGVVLDADALASFANHQATLFDAIRTGPHGVVLTPHEGEYGKLFQGLVDPALSKLDRARRAAALSGAIIVLKGPDTVVAAPDGRACIASSEAPWLATAGSGDVLAGMIGGLMAQAMPHFEAAAAAVWMHADAARRFGPGLISEDIPEMLPEVLRHLLEGPVLDGDVSPAP